MAPHPAEASYRGGLEENHSQRFPCLGLPPHVGPVRTRQSSTWRLDVAEWVALGFPLGFARLSTLLLPGSDGGCSSPLYPPAPPRSTCAVMAAPGAWALWWAGCLKKLGTQPPKPLPSGEQEAGCRHVLAPWPCRPPQA